MIFEKTTDISFENEYIRVSISKTNGEVLELFNKMSNKNALAESETPWFTYLYDKNDKIIKPEAIELEGERLKVTYENKVVAYLIIEVKKTYFSVTLDSELPDTVNGIVICELTTNAPWELDNPDAFGLSGIPMTTTVNNHYRPGGEEKIAKGSTYTYLGVSLRGSKLGVAFSRMTEHREHLKDITNDIDPEKGLTSTHGGAWTPECKDLHGDYVLLAWGLTPETLDETIELCKKYSVEQIDMHHGDETFIQGDFNFVCARNEKEKANNTFIPASVFKERIADKVNAAGLQLGLHTYSSLVVWYCERVTADPKWQKQIVTVDSWTLNGNVDEKACEITTLEDASNCIIINAPRTGPCPYTNMHTKFFLVDEEIVRVEKISSDGFYEIQRGQCGTKPACHKKGAKISQLAGWYGMFQPKPLSELFYFVAKETARAYNEGGYRMIYLDGLESFGRDCYTEERVRYYMYAEFIRTIVSNCEIDPLIEYSTFRPCLWAARGRGGAVDHARRAYKKQKTEHIMERQRKFLNCFYTATAGWFNYCPDKDMRYKDTTTRTMYRDDLDHMGSLCLAYNFGTVCQPFSKAAIEDKTRLADNFMYYGTYTFLREGGYFSPEVKNEIINGDGEYKVFKLDDGRWVFKEMNYQKHKIYDINEPNFTTVKAVNPYCKQKPFIRIEHRYSTNGENGTTLFHFDENKSVAEQVGRNYFDPVNITGKIAFKIRVHGNGSTSDAVMISIASPSFTAPGHYDYFIPVNFEGWKEITLIETNNADYDGYVFEDVPVKGGHTFRQDVLFEQINQVQLAICGECKDVKIGDLIAFEPIDAPARSPKITIGNETISFDAVLHGGDYIEYYPIENKAYLNYYTQIFESNELDEKLRTETLQDLKSQPEEDRLYPMNSTSKWLDDEAHTKEISFTGSITAPEGQFSYTYSAEPLTNLTTRAQVVIGLSGKVIANPSSWTAPEIDMPEGIEKVALY